MNGKEWRGSNQAPFSLKKASLSKQRGSNQEQCHKPRKTSQEITAVYPQMAAQGAAQNKFCPYYGDAKFCRICLV